MKNLALFVSSILLMTTFKSTLTMQGSNCTSKICTSRECVTASASLIMSMNPKVDPCKDFFQFACGRWGQKNPIPDLAIPLWHRFKSSQVIVDHILKGILEETNRPKDNQPIRQARKMFSTCMKADADELNQLEPPINLLDWPLLNRPRILKEFHWQKMGAQLRLDADMSVFVDVRNEIDFTNKSRNTIYISPDTSIEADVDEQETETILRGLAISLNPIAMMFSHFVMADIKALIEFEKQLAKIASDVRMFETVDDLQRNSERWTLAQLQRRMNDLKLEYSNSKIDWLKYLNMIYNDGAGMEIFGDEPVVVIDVQYFDKLVKLLDKTKSRVIENYMYWRVIRKFKFLATQRRILQVIQKKSKWNLCVDKVNDALGLAVSAAYVQRHLSKETKTEMLVMIKRVKTAFRSVLKGFKWLSAETKSEIRSTLNSMRFFIGHPNWILNKTSLEKYYQGLEVTANQTKNNLNSIKFQLIKKLEHLRDNSDPRLKWTSMPTKVGAYYSPFFHSIYFSAGMMHTMYSGKQLTAMNYGVIGSFIGHEIFHGIMSHETNINGESIHWPAKTVARLLKVTKCFIDQFNNYYPPVLNGTHVNGSNFEENLADSEGLRIAFRAFKDHSTIYGQDARLPGLEQYTPEQIFFISFANAHCGVEDKEGLEFQIENDTHSPARYRVVGSVSNSVDFSRHFQCPVGSPMNPVQKCVIA